MNVNERLEVDERLIGKVASLARLQLSENEKENYARDLGEVISEFSILREADVGNAGNAGDTGDVKKAEGVFLPIEVNCPVRADVVQECLKQEEALQFTKNSKEGFFVGPKVVG